MKTAITVILSGCALALAQPAAADGMTLSRGVKLCKEEMAKVPQLKRFTLDQDDTYASDTHLWIAFKVLDAEGRMDRYTCTVDRVGGTASVEQDRPRGQRS